MFRPHASSVRTLGRSARRRGALLIAVLGLLTLFAIFALFFVFYADAEATGARIAREKESPGGDSGPPLDYANAAFNFTLRSILFDDYDVGGVTNPLRGHSLARTMYGWNGMVGPTPGMPYSGIGTFHEGAPHGADRAWWINHSSPFTIPPGGPTSGTYWLDPEWTGFRLSAELGMQPGTIAARPQSYIPKHAPYTYPDLKDLILASLSPATGEVLAPSLHRNWLFNSNNSNQTQRLAPWDPDDDPAINPMTTTFLAFNTDWVTPEGRTRILRPRPVDQLTPGEINAAIGSTTVPAGLTGLSLAQKQALRNIIRTRIASGQIIPYPFFNAERDQFGNPTYSGDVQNLMGGLGQLPGVTAGGAGTQKNDSIWIDLGFPPRQWNGKWIKPLVGILLTDLDGLLNLNVHGNMRGGASTAPSYDRGYHQSHAGFGAHEVNLGKVLSTAEAVNVVQARYGFASWQPDTYYFTGQIVVNAGNFYQCVNTGVPPVGPPPGWRSAPAGTSAGPTGTYPGPAFFTDNQVQWSDVSISLARNGASRLLPERNGGQLPTYAAGNFDAGGNGPSTLLPSFSNSNAFQTVPTYSNTGNQTFFDTAGSGATYNKYLNNPLLFNPNDWPSGNQGRRTYPLSDIKRFNLRYATDRDWYVQTDVNRAGTANSSLIGTPGTFSGGAYRRDPAHYNRGLTTALSTGLDLPGFVANFNAITGNVNSAQTLNPGAYPYQPMQTMFPQPGPYPGTFPAGYSGTPISDFAGLASGGTDFRNQRLLGPVDLNRPLTSYYGVNAAPNNIGILPPYYTQAWADRHNLARDIFARLIVATGAVAAVDGSGNVTLPQPNGMGGYVLTIGMTAITVPVNEYNSLRYLAQLAANIVDYIDDDDFSTPFIWNPPGATAPPAAQALPAGLLVQTSNPLNDFQSSLNPTTLTDRAVFGVEKSKLQINEAFSELTNDPNEKPTDAAAPTQPTHVRFWLELLNPTNTAYAAGGTGPHWDGRAQVRYEAVDGVVTPFNPYQIVITKNNKIGGGMDVRTFLRNPANVVGSLPPGVNADIAYNFGNNNANATTANSRVVMPNNGSYSVGGSLTPAQGVLLVGPQIVPVGGGGPAMIEFNPTVSGAGAAAPWNLMIQSNPAGGAAIQDSMEYTIPNPVVDTSTGVPVDLQQHVVLLRRLAVPHYPPNDPATAAYNPALPINPYITVDYMDYVPSFDAINRGPTDTTMARTAKVMNMGAGYDPITSRFSVGKVAPHAGMATATPGNMGSLPTYSYLTSCVLPQNPNGYPVATITFPYPMSTFGRHNGRMDTDTYTAGTNQPLPNNVNETILGTPDPTTNLPKFGYDWFVHFDRALVNQLELLHVQAGRAHDVSQLAVLPPQLATNPYRKHYGVAQWLGVAPLGAIGSTVGTTGLTNNGLYRALELLRIKPWMYGTALGGKVHGRVNINQIQDPRLLQALLDSQSGNGFSTTDVNNLWLGLFNPTAPVANVPYRTARTRSSTYPDGTAINVPVPDMTYDDHPNPAAAIAAGMMLDRPFRSLGAAEFLADGSNSAYAARYGSGLQDTILRVDPTTNVPLITVPTAGLHPYYQAEMARKMFNNATTTSNAFSVTVTIVFHEVRMNGTNMMTVNEGTAAVPVIRYLTAKEVYKEIPGDLRQQFYAIIDRSNLVLAPGTTGLQSQPFSASLDAATSGAVPGQLMPIVGATSANANMPPQPMGFMTPPPQSVNVYLTNVTPAGVAGSGFPTGTPYAVSVNANQAVIFADGKPVTIQNGTIIAIGVGTDQEPQPFRVNYVNNDGSLNVGDPTNVLGAGGLPAPMKVHAPGELVSNYVPGNPGPQPFFDFHNTQVYGSVVPYVQRVR